MLLDHRELGNYKMSETKIKLTIDTNLINARQKDWRMNKIEQWRDEGKLSVVGTHRLTMEVAAYKNEKALDKEKKIPNVHEPGVLDKSCFDSCYFASSENNSPQFWDISSILFPRKDWKKLSDNESNDVMHLMAHYYAKVDIFLTNNTNDFVKDGRRESLKGKFGIVVMTPQEVVDEFSKTYDWS